MKIERDKPKETKEFKPVTLIITIESKEELLNLYHRTYINDSDIKNIIYKDKGYFDSSFNFYNADDATDLWCELSSIVQEKINSGEIQEERHDS